MIRCVLTGDKKAQWANFEQKKLVPFNFRVQLSGSDLKNQVDSQSSSDASKEDTDHDIQQLVAEEDQETKKFQRKSEVDSVNGSHASKHLENGNGHSEDSNEEDKEKQEAKIECKVRSEGVKIGVSSDFWNNYKLDIGLAEELGEQPYLRCCNRQQCCLFCCLDNNACA